jgi:hypothetical protein
MHVVGDVDGKLGPMTQDQARIWLEAKDSRKYNEILKNKLKSSVSDLYSASGSTASGGGNTRYTFQGAPLYHESNGAGATGGVSIFYVKREADVAKVVGLGYHVGAQTYKLTWVHHDWSAMRNENTICLD